MALIAAVLLTVTSGCSSSPRVAAPLNAPMCHAGSLQGKQAAFHTSGDVTTLTLTLTNKGTTACTVHGWLPITALDSANKALAAKVSQAPGRVAIVSLRPGDLAVVQLTFNASTGSTCTPVQAVEVDVGFIGEELVTIPLVGGTTSLCGEVGELPVSAIGQM